MHIIDTQKLPTHHPAPNFTTQFLLTQSGEQLTRADGELEKARCVFHFQTRAPEALGASCLPFSKSLP